VSLFVVAVGAAIYLALLAAVVIPLARPRQRLLVAYLAGGMTISIARRPW